MSFKMHKIIFLSRKKIYVCLPYLKFSKPVTQNTLIFYSAAKVRHNERIMRSQNGIIRGHLKGLAFLEDYLYMYLGTIYMYMHM